MNTHNSKAGECTAAERVPLSGKLGYGIGDFANNLVFQTVTLFMLFFFTDVFLLGASAAGIIFFAAKVWNAVCDPAVGYIADRTTTRWGRNRPFLLLGPLPLGISFLLLFAAPRLGETGRVAYALVTVLVFSTAYSVVTVPYNALTANLTLDCDERSSITGYKMTFAILGTLLTAGATKPVVALFPTQVDGFRAIGAIFGIIYALVYIVTFASVRENTRSPQEEGKSLKEDLRLVFQNGPFLVLNLACILIMVAVNIMAAMVNYYFKYNLSAEPYIPAAFLCLFITAMVAMPLWVFVSSRLGKKPAFLAGSAVLISALVALFLLPHAGITVILLVFVLGGIGMSTIYLCPWSMVPDTVEYSEWKSGLRREGILYGFFNFTFKFSSAFSGMLAGIGLDLVLYMPNARQADTTLFGMRVMMTIIPVAFIVIGMLVLHRYTMDAAFHRKIVEEIRARA